MKNIAERIKGPAAVDVSVAGWFLLVASLWELLFNRLFASLGLYNNVGASGFLSGMADSGHFAMNATGVMALMLASMMLPRMASDSRLAPLPARVLLILSSPLYLPVVFVAVFRPINAALILVGYLVCTCSVLFLGILVALKKLDGGRRRIVLAMALIQFIAGFELVASSYFSDLSQRVYLLSEALYITTPIFSFFVFHKGHLLAFMRRPHLLALISSVIATGFATLIVLAATEKTALTLVLVAFRSLGVTLSIPGGAVLYLVALFFGTLTTGSLILPSRKWPPSPISRNVGLGLACMWIAGIQPTHPYQFILVLVGFLYLCRSMLESAVNNEKVHPAAQFVETERAVTS